MEEGDGGSGGGLVRWAAFKVAGAASRRGQRGRRDIVGGGGYRYLPACRAHRDCGVPSARWLLIRRDRDSGRLGTQPG
jgi:hypothetical protein